MLSSINDGTSIEGDSGISAFMYGSSGGTAFSLKSSLPFGTLLHFGKTMPGGAAAQPPVLLVAPLSGHFATLLRYTARTLLQNHDVYTTD